VTQKVVAVAEAKKAKELQAFLDGLRLENAKMVEVELEKLRSQNKPPTQDELEKLLNQEYAEFTIKVTDKTGDKTFIIRELPQAIEKKLFTSIQKSSVPKLQALSNIEWTATATAPEKLQRVIDMVPDALDMLAENVALCLDPYGSEQITKEWVQMHLSSFRIVSVLQAQFLAGRFRDFFSQAYRIIPR
jgi:hypothetical protein